MKILFTLSFLFITKLCFSQTTTKSIDLNPDKEQLKTPSLEPNTPKTILDEGTNNPETTGSIKKNINGKDIFIKESEINGLKMLIVTEPN